MILASEIENNEGTSSSERIGVRSAASAVILDAGDGGDGNSGLGGFLFRYFPEHMDEFRSFATQRDLETQIAVCRSPELEDHYIRCAMATAEELLRREGLDLARVAAIFPPQISSDFIRRLAQAMEVDAAKFLRVTDDSGDLFTSSIPHALARACDKQLVRPGDVGLLLAVAPGIQVGCALYHF
jgi:3-oxoacyl-[acyl-carrier-protein] synthase III